MKAKCIVLTSAVLLFLPAPLLAQNLLTNGNFEQGNLNGWTRWNPAGKGGFTLGSHTSSPGWWPNPFGYGGSAGTPENPTPITDYFIYTSGGADDAWIYQTVSVNAGVQYAFSALAAGDGLSTAELYVFNGSNWSGAGSGETQIAAQGIGNNAWTRLRGYFTPSGSTVTVLLRIWDNATGEACADSLCLRVRGQAISTTVTDDMNGDWIWWDKREESGVTNRMTPYIADYDAQWWQWRGPWTVPVWPGAYRVVHGAGAGPSEDPNGYAVSLGGARQNSPERGPFGGIARDFDNLAPGTWKVTLYVNGNNTTELDGHIVYICAKVIPGGNQGNWRSEDYVSQTPPNAFTQHASGKQWGTGGNWVKVDSTQSNIGPSNNITLNVGANDFVRVWCYSEVQSFGRRNLYSMDYVQLVPIQVQGCDNDVDSDGVCDEQEHPNNNVPAGGSNRILNDSDGDGRLDGQEDANRNGTQDAGETSTRNRDTDGDQFEDGLDTQPLTVNAGFTDADRDGLHDPSDPNPANKDTDGDRIDDGFEAAYFGATANANNAGVKPPLGDANGDTFITSLDALIVQSLFLQIINENAPIFDGGTPGDNFRFVDVNRDGFATSLDALIIQSFFLQILPTLPLR